MLALIASLRLAGVMPPLRDRVAAKGCTERLDFIAVTGLNQSDFRTVRAKNALKTGACHGYSKSLCIDV